MSKEEQEEYLARISRLESELRQMKDKEAGGGVMLLPDERIHIGEEALASPAFLLFQKAGINTLILLFGDESRLESQIPPTDGGNLQGMSLLQIFPPDFFAKLLRAVSECRNGGKQSVFLLTDPFGTIYLVHILPVQGPGFAVHLQKQSDAPQAQELLLRSEQKYRRLFEELSLAFVMFSFDTQGEGTVGQFIFRETNPAFEKFIGYKLFTLQGKNISAVDISDREVWERILTQLCQARQSVRFVEFMPSVSKYIEIKSYFPEPGFVAILFSDVSERILAQKALRESEKRYKHLVESIPDAVLIVEDGKIAFANAASQRMLRANSHSEIIGHSFSAFIGDETKDGEINFRQRDISRLTTGFETTLNPGTDHAIAVEIRAVPLDASQYRSLMVLVRDLTEQKRASQILRLSEDKYRMLFNELRSGFAYHRIVLDEKSLPVDFQFIEVNLAFERIFGLKREDVIERTARQVFPETTTGWIEHCGTVALLGRPMVLEQHFASVGRTFEVVVYSPQRYHFATLFTDITERKKAEMSQKAEEERLRAILENMPVMLMAFDDAGTIVFWNNECERVTGYPNDEVVNNPAAYDFLYPDDMSRQSIREIAGTKPRDYRNIEWVVTCKDQSRKAILWSSIAAQFPISGWHAWVVGIDITQMKEVEKALDESRLRYRLTMQAINDGMWDRNILTGELRLSTRWFTMLGYRHNELTSNSDTFRSLLHPDDADMVLSTIEAATWSDEPFTIEFRMQNRDGGYTWIQSRGRSIWNDDHSQPVRILGTHTDISDRKIAEEELRMAKEKAEESDRLKSAFLANMSHEIRTPLNGILGFSRLLAEPELPLEKRDRYADVIETNSEQLLTLINDIIDLAKIESGQLDVFPEEVEVESFLRDVYHNFMANEKFNVCPELEFRSASVAGFLPASVLADRTRFLQVFNNLISNSIKFTHKGYIEFGIHSRDDAAMTFYVKDTGIGIAADKQEVIFERFRQEDESSTRSYGGTGLGLAITRNLVNLMNGKVWVESEKEVGTTFFFSLPLIYASKAPVVGQEVPPSSLKLRWDNHTILVVDDVEFVHEHLAALLEPTGARVVSAHSGYEAIEFCRQNKDINLIFMDIQMPGMNGIQAAQNIREICPGVPIIAQTAFALAGDKQKYLDAGCDAYISKPIKKEELLSLVNLYLSGIPSN